MTFASEVRLFLLQALLIHVEGREDQSENCVCPIT